MHIPDGYLSPSTCAVLYGTSVPFWYIALRRVKKFLATRLVPLLSVVAALAFVIMMFNLPLPGGTTGHAVGVAIATIILGPWASILAISTALLIQAIFFGDGGITTLGANCFNMAIVGSLTAYAVYRVVAGHAPLTSSRRVVAAALAGYTAINAAAFCAAVEFGIQPLFFTDPNGAPLYAPYALSIAIPAMMIGHLTFAGLAELVLSAGVVAYFQRTNPSLLKLTAPGALPADEAMRPVPSQSTWSTVRPLGTALALLLVLTPLGILAAGTAWGEWNARDFFNPQAREKIAAASGNIAPPVQAPRGLERLYSVWTAPFPQYTPAFVRRPAVGYALSAMFGSGIIILVFLIAGSLAFRRRRQPSSAGSNVTATGDPTPIPTSRDPALPKGEG
ncbi:MAG: cobalt transporter CbiM [Acidobacteriia bacterium]|nr:cobalt transporter CbiM [Terriglobia bacterium]